MTATWLVQLKSEHHQPGEEDPARVYQLVARDGTHGTLRATDEAGNTVERGVALNQLRYYEGETSEQSILLRAVQLGHNRIVGQMLASDPLLDPDGNRERNLLDVAGRLHEAAADRMVRTLIEHGANIHYQAFGNNHGPHWTALWNAVHDDNLAQAKRLMAHGADLDLAVPYPQQSAGYTVLHLAASCGAWEMMMWLMDQPNCPNACAQDLIHALKERYDGVDPQTYALEWSNGVKVPLLHLVASGDLEDATLARRFVKWLLDHGEEWEAVDHNGETAWQVARRLNSSMRVVFDEQLAQSQAVVLDATTPDAPLQRRHARM